MNTYSISKF